jgi:uncharacterized membrane protein YphA (DoxX/SURF4 family)
MITINALPAASGKGRLISLWILSGRGGSKLADAAAMVEALDKVGFGQWFRYFTGLLEVAAAIGLLISRHAFYAAVPLAIVMVGAIVAHVTALGSPPVAPAVLFLTGTIAYLRNSQNINQQRTKI